MSGLKESNMSNGEVLAVVNLNFTTKNPEPHNSPKFSGYYERFFYTLLVFEG
jgi:hypothetical protein